MSRVPPAGPRARRQAAPPRETERSFQAAVMQMARACGWVVGHMHDSRRQVAPGRMVGDRDAAGLPDLILVRDGRLVFAELKAERGRLRPAQRAWLEALRAVEADAAGRVLVREWKPRDWPEIQALLTRGSA